MTDLLNILIIDDNPDDRQLIIHELEKVFIIDTEEIKNREELDDALERWDFDIVITDYKLNWITGLDILVMIKNRDPMLPVIMFTGTGDEEIAVRAMKIGLDDYIIKSNEQFSRIPVTINRILTQIREQQNKQKMEARLQENEKRIKDLLDNAVVGYYQTTPGGKILYVNNTLVEMLGYNSAEELKNRDLEHTDLEPEYDRDTFKKKLEEQGQIRGLEATWYRKDGTHLYVRENARAIRNQDGEIAYYEGSAENITDVVNSRRIYEIMQNISNSIYSDIPLQDFYKSFLDDIRKIFPAGDLFFALYDEKMGALVIENATDDKQIISKRVPDKSSLFYYQLNNADTLLINRSEYEELSVQKNITTEQPFTQWLGARIKGHHHYIGVIAATHNEDYHYFTELEQSMFEFIATQIGIYIEKKKASDRIANARKIAEESDKLKSHFLANISHELRTPLNGIIGFSNMIMEHEGSDKQLIHYGNLIQRNARNLYHVLDNMIYMSSLESGDIASETGPVELYTFLADYFEGFIDSHSKPSLFYELKKDNRYEAFTLQTDAHLLTKVLDNLTDNAFKFTKDGKIKIGFDIDETKGKVRFFVSDTGIGIPQEHQYKIYQNFVTLESPLKGEYSGTGLGLAVSYNIIKKLGGAIWLESTPGEGSTFYFSLPLAQRPEQREAKPEGWPGKTILVVEDDPTSYQLVETILLQTTVDLIWAKNGDSARKVIDSNTQIDVVLLDIFLPGMDGISLLKHTKKVRPNVPVIGVTAYAMDYVRKECSDAGVDGFITKPIRKRELLNIIKPFLDESDT